MIRLYKEYAIGVKKLSEADLGWPTSSSSQTHIGLSEQVFKFLPNTPELREGILIYNRSCSSVECAFSKIGNKRSTKVDSTTSANVKSVVKQIRNIASDENLEWYLVWFSLDNQVPVFWLINSLSEDFTALQNIVSLDFQMKVFKSSMDEYFKILTLIRSISKLDSFVSKFENTEDNLLIAVSKEHRTFVHLTLDYFRAKDDLDVLSSYFSTKDQDSPIKVSKEGKFKLLNMFMFSSIEEINKRNSTSQGRRWYSDIFSIKGHDCYLYVDWYPGKNRNGEDEQLMIPDFINLIHECYGNKYVYRNSQGSHELWLVNSPESFSYNTTMTSTNLTPLSLYKEDLPMYWKDEKYKWEAVEQFQKHWDIEAEDFGNMFKEATSKHENLLASMNYFPVGMIQKFAEENKERTRNMFRELYNEDKNLAERINFFIDESEAIRKTHDSEWANHYQDLRAISAYLLFRYPNKYYIYKYTELKKTVEVLGDTFSFEDRKNNGTFYTQCVNYLDSLCERLKKDEELNTVLNNLLEKEKDCYKDSEGHVVTTDFFFYVGKRLDLKRLNKEIKDDTVESEEGIEDEQQNSNPVDAIEQISFNMEALIGNIKKTGLLYEDKLIQRYACSLMTKPFVILSGLAGSGKTQLALAFARTMSENVEQQLCVVPVGADWTNREPLLGYPNALKQGEYMQPESGALQIMMRAQRNPQKPYFLVLDEMNLSYVERYFADFLSALESNQKIPLWEKPDECDSEVDANIALPKNLFIVGTINVDETTYMFSPKVLDRANVIEFKISDTEMEQFLGQDMNIDVHAADGACANMGQDFVQKATSKETDNSELAQRTLLDFFKVLKKVNAEFGFRSATEIYRFIANAKASAVGFTEDEILDAAIVQKLLPKLHGSRKKLEPALKALWGLCMKDEHKTEAITRENAEQYAKFAEAADKIQRMMQTALDNGFTSFAEA